MSENDAAIKQMKLYQHVERVERALKSAPARGACPPETFEALDQLHYEGRDAVDHAAVELGLSAGSRVLDVGSGLGGPARWLAHRYGCQVHALELQSDLHASAERITQRCELSDRVEHQCGDVLDPGVAPGPFDALVSWLVFLHIPDRAALLARCRDRLADGAGLYVEDFYLRAPLQEEEQKLLREEVFCTHLVDQQQYRRELQDAGFRDVVFEDRTDVWTSFVAERQERFLSERERFLAEHDGPTFEALASFYQTMRILFEGGRLGGVRLAARATDPVAAGEAR